MLPQLCYVAHALPGADSKERGELARELGIGLEVAYKTGRRELAADLVHQHRVGAPAGHVRRQLEREALRDRYGRAAGLRLQRLGRVLHLRRHHTAHEVHVGDPNFVDVPLERLTGKEYAGGIAARIQAGERMHVERFKPEEPQDTTHVAVMDGDGNCVTMTHSLGMPSGAITPGLGFMYNGCMGVFDPRPGRAGSIAPGKSRFSSLCSTMVFDNGRPRIVLGAPGGTQIAMGVLQTLLNMIDFDMPVLDAVSAPRFSATSNAIDITNRIPEYTVAPLRQAGYEVIRAPSSFGIAAVHAIERTAEGLRGAADPGLDGVALGVRAGP